MRDIEFQRIYESAKACFEEGKLDDAEQLYQKLIDRTPNGYADIYNNLGLILFQKGLPERAATHFEKALNLNPRYTEASLNLVVTYNEMKRFGDAERVFSKAAEVVRSSSPGTDPFVQGKLANEHGKLGDSYYSLGRYQEALEEYHKALRLRPNFADILTKIGMTLREQGSLDEAVEFFLKAKSANPQFVTAYIHLGLSYYSRGDRTRAIQEWTAVQKMDPSHRGVQAYLALAKSPS